MKVKVVGRYMPSIKEYWVENPIPVVIELAISDAGISILWRVYEKKIGIFKIDINGSPEARVDGTNAIGPRIAELERDYTENAAIRDPGARLFSSLRSLDPGGRDLGIHVHFITGNEDLWSISVGNICLMKIGSQEFEAWTE